MNVIGVTGRLTSDPELRYTPSGKAIASFCIASDRPGTKDKTDFVDCIAWEKKAEFISKCFRKGQRIEVSGIITTDTYEKDGKKLKKTEVRCDQVFFGDNKKSDKKGEDSQSSDLDDVDLPF